MLSNNKILLFFLGVLTISFSASAQSNSLIEDEFEIIASDWLNKSEDLKFYEGVNQYCLDPNYRQSMNGLLRNIHYYDSLVLDKLSDPGVYLVLDQKEQKKTLKDIYEMEEEFSVAGFVEQMKSSCTFRNEIEANAENLRNGVGVESYDGKVLVLETEMQRYINKVDRLVVRIDDHLHLLHIEN